MRHYSLSVAGVILYIEYFLLHVIYYIVYKCHTVHQVFVTCQIVRCKVASMAGVILYIEYFLSHVRQYTSAILYTEYLLSHVSQYTSGMTRYVGMSTNGVMV